MPLSMTEHNFPPLQNDLILKTIRGEPVDRVPVWIMRQAGRYLPEFQEVRAKHDFFDVCQNPSLACEVTLQPIKRFDLDASIIFSDILTIPQAMGMTVDMVPKVGPVLPHPLNDPSDLSRLVKPAVEKDLKYVGDAITLTRHKLEGKVPLIGFTGAPWTLMGYMVQGGGSSTMAKPRTWLYKYPNDSQHLLELITDVVVDYLVMQVKAGAQLLQVFESNGDYLNDELFVKYSLPYFIRISNEVRTKLKEQNIMEVPMIAFPKGATMSSLKMLAKTQCYDVIGLDWTVDPAEARNSLGIYLIFLEISFENSVRMESPLPHIMESADCDSTVKPKDRLVNLLDQIEVHVEQLRRDAWRLEEEKDTLLTTLDTIRNNELLGTLEEPDKDDVLRYAERLSMRCLTVDVLVKIQRDTVQQEALHQVNGLIDGLVIGLRQDPSGTRQKCAAFMNACSSQAMGHSDKNFETAILGCTIDDQKRVKKRLQGLLDYIDKMHTIEFQ
ncbi:hypothetical protein KPH14_011812 [Odynerus spinipes]|uniref:Uroporphyrinogen decarboxylase n=1 Tax=Odynerus spinipes TaxID=1348599 RepID=A0AAD9VUP0_9HYME|nr:hypothetical protein KPH14_011812 [Odynerus spinipes]